MVHFVILQIITGTETTLEPSLVQGLRRTSGFAYKFTKIPNIGYAVNGSEQHI